MRGVREFFAMEFAAGKDDSANAEFGETPRDPRTGSAVLEMQIDDGGVETLLLDGVECIQSIAGDNDAADGAPRRLLAQFERDERVVLADQQRHCQGLSPRGGAWSVAVVPLR